jgi:surfactin synthase thioesterase subunit
MNIHRLAFGRIGNAFLIAGFCLGGVSSVQAFEATAEQQEACTPDAFRLCSSEIPDAQRVEACMKANMESLSPPCRAVFQTTSLEPSASRHRHRVQPILSDYAHD